MAVVKVRDGEIYYEVAGEGAPIVFAHGVGGNHTIWFQQLPEFSSQFRTITFDHRGFGNSVDRGGHGRSEFVADLKAVLDDIGLARVSLVGQSMGGGTCIGFTCRYPDRVSKLVVCDSLHGIQEPRPVKELMDQARIETAHLTQLERVLGARVRLGDPLRALLYSQLNSFNQTNRHNLKGQFDPLFSPDELASTGVPTLFLVGQSDVLFPAAAVREMSKHVQGAEFIEVAGSGHSVFFEDPATFNSVVMSFLSQKSAI
ncbi:MAG: alpha/beta hydrolase [Woeseia sp.]|nr:alpha/beta hydrolase [Woeseia sp.]